MAINDARIKFDHIHWDVPHFTPSIQQQGIISKRNLSKTPTELRYFERSIFLKEVKHQNLWNSELGSKESMKGPIRIFSGFEQQDRQDSKNLNSDTFCRLPVASAQCKTGKKNYPDAAILLNYDDDGYI